MKGKPQGFNEAVEAARLARGWTHAEISEKLAVRPQTLANWLKPAAESKSVAPVWAVLALHALTYEREVTERRGAFEITYAPARTSGKIL